MLITMYLNYIHLGELLHGIFGEISTMILNNIQTNPLYIFNCSA